MSSSSKGYICKYFIKAIKNLINKRLVYIYRMKGASIELNI